LRDGSNCGVRIMVSRKKLNKPFCVTKNRQPVLWVTEVGTDWFCDHCKQRQDRNTVAVQTGIKGATTVKSENTALGWGRRTVIEYKKVFICGPCAIELCQELSFTLQSIGRTSIDAYITMEEL